MKVQLRKMLGLAADRAGILQPLIYWAQGRSENSLTVLMYHRVIDHGDPLFRGIDVEQFETQMAYISRHWNPVSEQQILDFYCQGISLPKGAVFVTFDDGYKDAYTLALPILKKYRIPAILFVSSDPVIKGEPLWTDELALLFKHTRQDTLTTLCGDVSLSYDLCDTDLKVIALFDLKKHLKQVPDQQRKLVLDDVREKLGAVPEALRRGLLVNEAQMCELVENGVALGAHTKTHPILSKVSDSQAEQEIFESRDYLLNLGYPQNSFCYPNGERQDYNDMTLSLVSKAGYSLAFTTIEGGNDAATNPLELKRLHVSGIPIQAFKYKLLIGLLKLKRKDS